MPEHKEHHWLSRIVEVFLRGNLSVLLILLSLIAGGVALWLTPREEEPQIVVPLADVLVQVPGAARPRSSSRSRRGWNACCTRSTASSTCIPCRGRAGDRHGPLLRRRGPRGQPDQAVQQAVHERRLIPPGVAGWVVKPIEIDDVPIVYATLWSRRYDAFVLRRVAEQVEVALQAVPNTARTEVVGGQRRQVRVELDPDAMAARRLTPQDVVQVLRSANVNVPAGSFSRDNREWLLECGPYLQSARELESLVVGVFAGQPVYLRDVLAVREQREPGPPGQPAVVRKVRQVLDGPEEPLVYTRIGFGPAAEGGHAAPPSAVSHADAVPGDFPAVTVAVAKRRGTNAVWVARDIERKLEELRAQVLPTGVEVSITRNYGETANAKVNELVEHLTLAIIIVVALIGFALGWREAVIVVTVFSSASTHTYCSTVHAYNTSKFRKPGEVYHPRDDDHVGYVVELDGRRVNRAGDTDHIPEMGDTQCDVALVPVSGDIHDDRGRSRRRAAAASPPPSWSRCTSTRSLAAGTTPRDSALSAAPPW